MLVTRKGQVTIPAKLRATLGIPPGTEVEFVVSNGNLILRKLPSRPGKGQELVAAMRGRANRRLSTEQIITLTRSE